MITLNSNSQTSVTSTFNGVSTTTVTDTLFVSYVELGFESGSVTAMIKRGTAVFIPATPAYTVTIPEVPAYDVTVPAVPATDTTLGSPEYTYTVPAVPANTVTVPEVLAHTNFIENQPMLRVDVQSNGDFRSNDGVWVGTLPNWTAALAQLRAPFDGHPAIEENAVLATH